jgi:long-chain acyl-CoA synthetase
VCLHQVLALPVLNGWGLTETSPVLACRRVAPARDNVRGTVGLPTPGTAVRVVDPETLQPLPMGAQVPCPSSSLPA